VHGERRHRRVEAGVGERQRPGDGVDRRPIGRALRAHRGRGLDRRHLAVGRLVRPGAGADVQHRARAAEHGGDPGCDPRIGPAVCAVGAAHRAVVGIASAAVLHPSLHAGQRSGRSYDRTVDADEIRARLRALPVFEQALPPFPVDEAPDAPAPLFWQWLLDAIEAGVREPHAFTLATSDADGRPTTRVLILKGLEDGRWQFASGATSRKGAELAATPFAAINVYWPELGRQVRVRGRVEPAGPEASARDFLARSAGARAEALAGRSGEVLRAPAELDAALAAAAARIAADPALVAPAWTLWSLVPDEVEFLQADRERRHTRLRYLAEGGGWRRDTLFP
jgi:pyridoxamine 5'-phosphate oxidase